MLFTALLVQATNPLSQAECAVFQLTGDTEHLYVGGKEVRPGPADYNSSLPGSSAQAGVSLKFKHEGALASKEAAALFGSPGPGAYSAGSGRPGDRGPAFTIGQRLHYKQQGDSPGPGAYEHE